MGCNCGAKMPSNRFVYTSPSGQSTEYKSEVEARAAAIRGGGGTVKKL